MDVVCFFCLVKGCLSENKANKVVVRAEVRETVAVEVAVVVVQVHELGLVRTILSGRPVARVALVLTASGRLFIC